MNLISDRSVELVELVELIFSSCAFTVVFFDTVKAALSGAAR